jgi:hypothetical protein
VDHEMGLGPRRPDISEFQDEESAAHLSAASIPGSLGQHQLPFQLDHHRRLLVLTRNDLDDGAVVSLGIRREPRRIHVVATTDVDRIPYREVLSALVLHHFQSPSTPLTLAGMGEDLGYSSGASGGRPPGISPSINLAYKRACTGSSIDLRTGSAASGSKCSM